MMPLVDADTPDEVNGIASLVEQYDIAAPWIHDSERDEYSAEVITCLGTPHRDIPALGKTIAARLRPKLEKMEKELSVLGKKQGDGKSFKLFLKQKDQGALKQEIAKQKEQIADLPN